MPVTEFAYFGVKPGSKILDDSTWEGRYMTQEWETACLQPGAHRAYWHLQIEDPSKLVGFLDWDEVENHHNWLKTEWNASVTKELPRMLEFDGTEFVKHLNLRPWPPTAALDAQQNGPLVTEVLMAWFPSDINNETRASAEAKAQEFKSQALETNGDIKGVSSGWSVERDIPIIGAKGKVGSLFAVVIGWTSLEASQKARETYTFKDGVALLQGMDGLIALNNLHVSCRSFEASK